MKLLRIRNILCRAVTPPVAERPRVEPVEPRRLLSVTTTQGGYDGSWFGDFENLVEDVQVDGSAFPEGGITVRSATAGVDIEMPVLPDDHSTLTVFDAESANDLTIRRGVVLDDADDNALAVDPLLAGAGCGPARGRYLLLHVRRRRGRQRLHRGV